MEDAAREKMEAALRRVREAGHLREYTPGEIFAYKIQKVFALPLMGKILCLFALTVPMVFVGGSVHKLVMSEEDKDKATFICTESKLRRGTVQKSLVASRVCSKIK